MKGKTEPRIWTAPMRELTAETSLGFAAIEYAKTILCMELYPWQEWALIHILEIVGDLEHEWRFRYRTVVIMVSRQNGKTEISKVIASFFLNVLCVEAVFGTSLSMDKAEEVWEAVILEQETHKALASEIQTVARRNGGKKLVLTGLRTYKVGAPTRRAGRGDANDLVMLDEVREHRDWETWSAAVASTNAKPNGLVMCFSNAGDPDSIVLRQLRSQALEKINGTKAKDFGGDVDSDSLGWFEWSSPDNAETDDMEALAQANPALGYGRLTERALLSNRETFPENKFRSECMCQQVETILPEPFPDGAWLGGVDENSFIREDSDLYFGIDMSQDRKWTVISVCGMREDGNYHTEIVERRIGTEWAIDWFRSRVARYGGMNLAFQGRGAPVSGLAEQICTIKGIQRMAQEGPELSSGWNRFWDAIAACAPEDQRGGIKCYHLPQPVLDTPGRTCQLRNLGGGIMLPDRNKSPDDISPLMACAMAYAAATAITKKEKKIYESSYASGGGLIFV
ncbi:MAG: hypothetical protein IKA94_02825 [Mogibacterium sp.]|nr:hypothetical protein [Mogibacterium sp.]